MTQVDQVGIYVVKQGLGKKTIGARGFGWPMKEENEKSNQQFLEEMERVKGKIDIDQFNIGDKVAEFDVRRRDNVITEVEILD